MSIWAVGEAYEPYIGRWSRLAAREFLTWLGVQEGGAWLDVGCGTGALSESILTQCNPVSVTGIDASEEFVAYARAQVSDPRAQFQRANAEALPIDSAKFDAAVSGLVLNFLPEPALGISEMVRVTRPGGTVAAYLWDYASQMLLIRHFWDAATLLDPSATALDEGRRFPLCQPEPLEQLFLTAGLDAVEVRAIDVPTVFRDFDDFWSPFLGGQGPAPSYVMALDEARRSTLRENLRARLPVAADGSIHLMARAWAARGRNPRAPTSQLP